MEEIMLELLNEISTYNFPSSKSSIVSLYELVGKEMVRPGG